MEMWENFYQIVFKRYFFLASRQALTILRLILYQTTSGY